MLINLKLYAIKSIKIILKMNNKKQKKLIRVQRKGMKISGTELNDNLAFTNIIKKENFQGLIPEPFTLARICVNIYHSCFKL